jgi:TamB, inner membrane protein subunit of TAM complex
LIKKILLILFILILIPLAVLFFRPGLILNPKNLAFVLHKTKVLNSWHWDEATFTHEWFAWNDRGFSGKFKNFCLKYGDKAPSVETCMETISWDIRLKNLKVITEKPFIIDSSILMAKLPEEEKKEKTPPPDIYNYWTMLWSDLVPDMDFKFHKIVIKDQTFDLFLIKQEKKLSVSALKFELTADPEKFQVKAPSPYAIPKKLPLARPLYLRNFVLTGEVKKTGIPLHLNGFLEAISVNVESFIKLPVTDDFSSIAFRKRALLATTAHVYLDKVKEAFAKYSPKPYQDLPAPFNVMNGFIKLDVAIKDNPKNDLVNVNAVTTIDLTSQAQDFDVDITSLVPLNLVTFKPTEIGLDLDFKKVKLELPRLSKKSPPPQFIPDSRFKKQILPPEKKESIPSDIEISALNEKAMHIKTNLLDEELRLNFDLKLNDGKAPNGFVKILPLKTSVFKRPIRVQYVDLKFSQTTETLIDAIIKFPLPEYKITLKLEGPVSKPRYAFESDPPLPQNDIYAVLLFGRPLADLDPDDKNSAAKTNQLLSQGILSLSVLYFLAGSPVEYVGYDPNSKNATAQFGLGKKSSLRVGGGSEGVNSTAIRRSLGKGWYLDTSVQQSQEDPSSSPNSTRDYGVLLERIISY